LSQIFVSYSHKDRQFLDRLHVFLKPLQREETVDIWDDTRIAAGSDWQAEIRKALTAAQVAVLFVSADFLASDFIVKNELPPLLAQAESGGTVILSVIVGPCRFHETKSLSRFQAVNEPSKPLRALPPVEREKVFLKLSQVIENIQERRQAQQDILWETETIKESGDGHPGYEFELQYFHFSSTVYRDIIHINRILEGTISDLLLQERLGILGSTPRSLPSYIDPNTSKDLFNAHCSEPSIVGHIMSIQYTNWSFPVGAAHPNHYFMTFAFLLEPLAKIESLSLIFGDPNQSFLILQSYVRNQLYDRFGILNSNQSGSDLARRWIDEGTASWNSLSQFKFVDEGIEILFPPLPSCLICGWTSDCPNTIRSLIGNY
jgi:hypothetical protein